MRLEPPQPPICAHGHPINRRYLLSVLFYLQQQPVSVTSTYITDITGVVVEGVGGSDRAYCVTSLQLLRNIITDNKKTGCCLQMGQDEMSVVAGDRRAPILQSGNNGTVL